MTARNELFHTPAGTPYPRRHCMIKWIKYHGGRGCWGLWLHATATKKERLRKHMSTVRKDRVSRYFPKGTPRKLQTQYYHFIYTHGRCTYEAWLAWVTLKGPYPLQYL